MIERYFDKPDDVEQIDRWMKAPPESREKLPEYLEDKLERLIRAHKWRMAHHSRRATWPMMHAYYTAQGRKYSENTARQDVIDAERLFLTITPHTGPFIASMMIDSLYEEYHSAARRGDTKGAKGYSAELDKWVDRMDQYVKERESAITAPIPILAVFDLKEAQIDVDPRISQKIAEWKKRREAAANSHTHDAEFTEVPPDAPGDT